VTEERKMSIKEMTRKDFEDVELRHPPDAEIWCDSVVLLPTNKRHETGYRVLELVAIRNHEPLCRIRYESTNPEYSGIDSVEFVDIRGDEVIERWDEDPKKQRRGTRDYAHVKLNRWKMDCLPRSGLFQFWGQGCRIRIKDDHACVKLELADRDWLAEH
jgi:hypothetical protein